MHSIEQMENNTEELTKIIPTNLEFNKEYSNPIVLHDKYRNTEKEIIANQIQIARLGKNADKKNRDIRQQIEDLQDINDTKRRELAQNIIDTYLSDDLDKKGTAFLNCIVPTTPCIPEILSHVLEIVLKNKLNVSHDKIGDINTIFAEIYGNYMGKTQESRVASFPLQLLIKNNQLQILAGNPKLEDEVTIKDLDPEDLMDEGGRGLPLCKGLCEYDDGSFSAKTDKEQKNWAYLAKINY